MACVRILILTFFSRSSAHIKQSFHTHTKKVGGHYYRGGTYLLASLVLDGLLLRTAPALLFCGLMYPMVGLLPEATRVATFMFVLATYTCTVGALTTALAALCRSASATTLAMNIILLMVRLGGCATPTQTLQTGHKQQTTTPQPKTKPNQNQTPTKTKQWVLVGGYLVNPMSIPAWLRWVRCLSPMSFAFEVLAANEMADQVYALRVAGFAQLDGIKGDGARAGWLFECGGRAGGVGVEQQFCPLPGQNTRKHTE
jgi:hypothetical protein